jgi:hypothetical protein
MEFLHKRHTIYSSFTFPAHPLTLLIRSQRNKGWGVVQGVEYLLSLGPDSNPSIAKNKKQKKQTSKENTIVTWIKQKAESDCSDLHLSDY